MQSQSTEQVSYLLQHCLTMLLLTMVTGSRAAVAQQHVRIAGTTKFQRQDSTTQLFLMRLLVVESCLVGTQMLSRLPLDDVQPNLSS